MIRAVLTLLLSVALAPSLVSGEYGCTDVKVYNCTKSSGLPPFCASGVSPVQQRDCCYSCRPGYGRCNTPVDPINTPICAAGVEPTADPNTFCPTCIKSCGDVQTAACLRAMPSLPACDFGVKPVRNTTSCCFNCNPTVTQCSKEAYEACDANRMSLPVCQPDSNGIYNVGFDPSTCCAKCRRPDSKPPVLDGDGKCSDAAMKACMASVPICVEGQKPTQISTACCPSCKRPESLCTVLGVVACEEKLPLCGPNERPVHIDGDCCASCHPALPTCAPACGSKQLCIGAGLSNLLSQLNVTDIDRFLNEDSISTTGECVPKVTITLTFKENSPKYTTLMKALAPADYARLLNEAVDRFCDNIGVLDKCNRYRAFLKYIVVVNLKQRSNSDGVDTVTIDVPAPFAPITATRATPSSEHEQVTMFREVMELAASNDSPSSLLTSAATDPSSSGDVTVGVGVTSSSVAFLPSLFAIIAATLLALFAVRM